VKYVDCVYTSHLACFYIFIYLNSKYRDELDKFFDLNLHWAHLSIILHDPSDLIAFDQS
jgi:hypothetical protein